MKRTITVILFSMLVLSGCASPTIKSWSAISGSKADGTVKLAYPIALFDNASPPESEGKILAAKRCKAWGYQNASSFGGNRVQCDQRNGFGQCLEGMVIREYQCIG